MAGSKPPRPKAADADSGAPRSGHPAYRRFVALAGVDDHLVDRDYGALIAGKPGMIFKVFLDGQLAAASPVMRISQEPWRFDVLIPPASRQINLVVTSCGEKHPYNLGNWVDAGFVTGSETRSYGDSE